MDQASDVAQSVAQQGKQVAARVQETSEDAYHAVERTIRDQPVMTLALGVAFGFALGALWKTGGGRSSWADRLQANYYEPAMRSWRNSNWW